MPWQYFVASTMSSLSAVTAQPFPLHTKGNRSINLLPIPRTLDMDRIGIPTLAARRRHRIVSADGHGHGPAAGVNHRSNRDS